LPPTDPLIWPVNQCLSLTCEPVKGSFLPYIK
jgi:hypothetical protein